MAGTEQKVTKKRDPDEAPAIVLLDAVITALTAGVESTEIVSSLRFARGATGYKAPVWRAAATSLTEAAKRMNGAGAPVVAQGDVELRSE